MFVGQVWFEQESFEEVFEGFCWYCVWLVFVYVEVWIVGQGQQFLVIVVVVCCQFVGEYVFQ